jgi:D-alanyl-D-alanine carboxypeptidase (penicillin-binding protein 5/6)
MTGRRLAVALVAFCLAFTAGGALLLWPPSDDDSEPAVTISGSEGRVAAPEPEPTVTEVTEERPAISGEFAVTEASGDYAVNPRFKQPPGAGLLFDVDTGEVLWARRPAVERPIASLTKMMTALLIAEDHRAAERVTISAKAPGVEGSRIGVLKPGSKVPLRGLFLGLMMVSGNDAAVALAEHDAGSVARFVRRMNRRAAELGLTCSRFAGPAGLQDTGNSSCAYDLAALARADLANGWVASVTSRRAAEVPFPAKGGTLSLANNHYFVQTGVAGLPKAQVTGVKTGLTNGAGRCYVTTARLGDRHLGVVLLDSDDPIRQVPALLRAGFASTG